MVSEQHQRDISEMPLIIQLPVLDCIISSQFSLPSLSLLWFTVDDVCHPVPSLLSFIHVKKHPVLVPYGQQQYFVSPLATLFAPTIQCKNSILK